MKRLCCALRHLLTLITTVFTRVGCALRHVTRHHVFFALCTTVPQCMVCALDHFYLLPAINLGLLFFWLSFPCRDPHFGVGRPFHWFRQTYYTIAILIGGALVLLAHC